MIRSAYLRTGLGRGVAPSATTQLPLRAFSCSALRLAPSPIQHPTHPHPLFLHPLSSNIYAVSLLSAAPSSPTAASVVATFQSRSAGTDADLFDEAQSNPDRVSANKAFLTLLHATLKDVCVPQDGLMQYEAALRKSGWIHASGKPFSPQLFDLTATSLTFSCSRPETPAHAWADPDAGKHLRCRSPFSHILRVFSS